MPQHDTKKDCLILAAACLASAAVTAAVLAAIL